MTKEDLKSQLLNIKNIDILNRDDMKSIKESIRNNKSSKKEIHTNSR